MLEQNNKVGKWQEYFALHTAAGTTGEPISCINDDFIRRAKEVRMPIKDNKSAGVGLLQDSLA
eukprot:2844119-Ditylum_brightwellii.AAC.1